MTFLISIVTSHGSALILSTVQSLHHALRILLRHLDVGKLTQQVDVTHLLATLHVLVQILHDFARIETICLTQVDEQSLETNLSLMLSATIGNLATAFATTSTTFAATGTLAGLRLDNLRSILIVIEELTEGDGHHLLDDVLLVDVLKLAVDFSHVWFNLILIHIGLHNVVHGLEELLLADFLWGWQYAIHEVLANLLLYLANLELLSGMDDRDGCSLLSGTTRTAASVGVTCHIIRQPIVDNVSQIIYVQTTGSHIGSHQELNGMVAELLHGEVTLLLTQVAVQRLCIITILNQLICNILSLQLGAAEDNRKDAWIEIHHALQGEILVLGIYQIVDVVYMLSTLVTRTHYDFLVVVQVVEGNLLDVLAHCSREEQGVSILRNVLEDGIDALREAHVQHLVSLIKHHVVHVLQLSHATINQIEQTARGSHDNLHTMLQGANLASDVGTAINCGNMQTVDVLGKAVQIVCYLETELTCRTEDDSLCLLAAGISFLDNRNTVRCCLTRTGLRQRNHVVLITKQIWDNFFLNWHWILKSKLFDGTANLFAHAQFFKCLQIFLTLIHYNQNGRPNSPSQP